MPEWAIVKPYRYRLCPWQWPSYYRMNRRHFGRLRSAWLAMRVRFACIAGVPPMMLLDNFGIDAEDVMRRIEELPMTSEPER